MYGLIGFNLKQIIAAVIISCTVASVLCAAMAANAAGVVGPGPSVNRASKADRLPSNPALPVTKRTKTNSSETSPLPVKIPVGCEPTFSPVVNPGLQSAARSCLT
jgi:hypothetical protein